MFKVHQAPYTILEHAASKSRDTKHGIIIGLMLKIWVLMMVTLIGIISAPEPRGPVPAQLTPPPLTSDVPSTRLIPPSISYQSKVSWISSSAKLLPSSAKLLTLLRKVIICF